MMFMVAFAATIIHVNSQKTTDPPSNKFHLGLTPPPPTRPPPGPLQPIFEGRPYPTG